MPYVTKDRRRELNGFIAEVPATSGELNYMLTECVKQYVLAHGLEYRTINDVLGALDGAAREFYDRIARPYEDKKIAANGDVYTVLLNELERA
jgi:hypothetical protein